MQALIKFKNKPKTRLCFFLSFLSRIFLTIHDHESKFWDTHLTNKGPHHENRVNFKYKNPNPRPQWRKLKPDKHSMLCPNNIKIKSKFKNWQHMKISAHHRKFKTHKILRPTRTIEYLLMPKVKYKTHSLNALEKLQILVKL